MPDIHAMHRSAHDQLNEAYDIFQKSHIGGLAHEFDAIKLQASIFQYEICVELGAFVNNNPSEFARKVSLKGIVHKLFEYNLVSNGLLRRVTALSRSRGFEVSDEAFKNERRKWRLQFKKLAAWSSVRNTATGHYDKDTDAQAEALNLIDPEEVMSVVVAFLSANMAFLQMLRAVGRRHGT